MITQLFQRRSVSHHLVCALLLVYAGALLWQTPGALRDIDEREQLERRGAETLGEVVGLRPIYGRNRCESTALIQYRVAQVAYRVAAAGCGAASEGGLKIGASASVVYLPDAPQVARAVALDVHTKRSTWNSLLVVWLGFVLTTVIAALWLASRARPAPGGAAAPTAVESERPAAVARRRPRKKTVSARQAAASHESREPAESTSDDQIRAFWKAESRLKNNRRASKVAGFLAILFGPGSVAFFVTVGGPPYVGKGAAWATALHAKYGPIGPALPWLGVSALFVFIWIAAARDWGEDKD